MQQVKPLLNVARAEEEMKEREEEVSETSEAKCEKMKCSKFISCLKWFEL